MAGAYGYDPVTVRGLGTSEGPSWLCQVEPSDRGGLGSRKRRQPTVWGPQPLKPKG